MSTRRTTNYNREMIAERDYWVARFSVERPVTNLILDFERPETYLGEKQSVDLVLPDETYEKLIAQAGDSAFLTYVTLLAALKACLYQYTGSSMVVVGSPARKKDDINCQRPNALAIISRIKDRGTFQELLDQVRETLLQAYSKQTYSVTSLIRDMGLDHIQNRCPLFDLALALKELHCSMPDLKNDVTITFGKGGGKLTGRIEFNRSLFAKESIINFGHHYLQVLKQGLDTAGVPISRLGALAEADRRHTIVGWNDTADGSPGERTINLLFEERVNDTPEATAITFGTRQVSYLGLNRHANQLAHYLRRFGVGPEVIVGIYLNRSIEMVVALLGVLKAGGCYVPMNPKDPRDRLSFILNDTAARVVLTDSNLARSLPEHKATVVRLDAACGSMAQESVDDPVVGVLPDNLVYVMYTSGSTGKPKGVQVTHAGLSNLAREQARSFGIKAHSRVLQFASLSFDASASEIFASLLAGATLCLASQDMLLPGPGLMRLLRENEITCVTLPPSVLLAAPKGRLPALQTLVVAGEACPAKLVNIWGQGLRFLNAYGPTEATVCAAIAECKSFERKPPIGKPMANTQVFLLRADRDPVAIGVPGELHISGVGLARGYMNRPGLTAEKFLPNPFSPEPGKRLYATGDMARYLSDGSIDFLGRIDYQLKLRGFRIEPGEIEETLRQHERVLDAVIVAREDTPGNKRLVAYVVASCGEHYELKSEPQTIADVRSFLQEKLPEYMIPSSFVLLEALPLTAHGKIDRQSLPAPRQTRSDLSQEYVGPRNTVEAAVSEIWAQALGIEQVGIHDNFFELGGLSLMVPEVTLALQKVLGVELPLRAIFETPTVAGIAEALDQACRGGIETVPIINLDHFEAEQALDSPSLP